jgi:hypothetical protein
VADGEFCSSQAPNGDSSTAHAVLPRLRVSTWTLISQRFVLRPRTSMPLHEYDPCGSSAFVLDQLSSSRLELVPSALAKPIHACCFSATFMTFRSRLTLVNWSFQLISRPDLIWTMRCLCSCFLRSFSHSYRNIWSYPTGLSSTSNFRCCLYCYPLKSKEGVGARQEQYVVYRTA